MIVKGKIASINGYPLTENWYRSMVIPTPQQVAEGLRLAWNVRDRGLPCPKCKARGTLRGENVGCPNCHGLGVVPYDE